MFEETRRQGGQTVARQVQVGHHAEGVEQRPGQGVKLIAGQVEGGQGAEGAEDVGREGGEAVAGQVQGRQGVKIVEQAGGQGGELIAGQIQGRQGVKTVEQAGGQGGELIAGQGQGGQGIETVEVLALKCADVPGTQTQLGDAAQVGRGDVPARGHPGRRDKGLAHRQGAAADGSPHRKGEREAGGLILAVGGNPRVDPRLYGDGRCTGQRQRVSVQGQPGRQGRGLQGVDQAATAVSGRRQSHGRHRGAGDIHLRRNAQHAKIGHGGGVIVKHRDHHAGSRGGGAVAADGMADGETLVRAVVVTGCHDGDGPDGVPVCGGEDQGRGQRHRTGGANGRRDRDVTGRLGVQPHGVACLIAFEDGEGGRGDVHPGPGRDGQSEAQVVVVRKREEVLVVCRLRHAGESGVAEADGCR